MNTEEENKTSNPSSKIKNESECTIGSICSRFSSGKGITAEKISPTGEYPVYGGNGVRGYTDNYNFEGQCVVIGRQGANCGNVKYFEGKAYMSEHAIVGVTHQEHDNRYFAYKLSMLNLGRFSGQAAQPGLSVAKLKTLKITMPNFNIQYRIASILSAYDRLIENNTRRIRLLEQMAENLYKEWFVRFRFPEHEKVEMVNGLPKGWKVEKLGDYANISTGKCNREDAEEDGIYPLFDRSQEIKKSSKWIKDCEAIIVPGEGTSFIPRYYKGKFNLHQRCYCIEPRIKDIGFYLFYSIMLNRKYFLSVATGATVPSLRQNNFTKMKLIIAELELVKKYNKIASTIALQIDKLKDQNTLLTRQRDLLLPRLMSGKLEVKS